MNLENIKNGRRNKGMKTHNMVLSVLLLIAATVLPGATWASGCGNPVWVPSGDSRVLNSTPLSIYDARLILSKRQAPRIEIDLYSELMPYLDRPEMAAYWHTISGEVPVGLGFKELDIVIADGRGRLELVDDVFVDSVCGGEAQERGRNLRLRLNFNGTTLIFRTTYTPRQ
jgi:hypothetical protein